MSGNHGSKKCSQCRKVHRSSRDRHHDKKDRKRRDCGCSCPTIIIKTVGNRRRDRDRDRDGDRNGGSSSASELSSSNSNNLSLAVDEFPPGPPGLEGFPPGPPPVIPPVVGPTGATGPQGDPGDTGPQGDTGPTGPKCTGPTGEQGIQGDTGPIGADGLLGPTGLQGDDGSDGTQGDIGPTGLQGDIGMDGMDGESGSTGPTGPSSGSGGITCTGGTATVNAVALFASPDCTTVKQSPFPVTIDATDSINLPPTNFGLPPKGVIYKNGTRFIHNFPQDEKNTYVGLNAGNFILPSEGGNNTAVGFESQFSIRGIRSTSVGTYALREMIDSSENTAIGWGAMRDATKGGSNVAVGSRTLGDQIDARFNTAVGWGVGPKLTTGGQNTLIGAKSGENITTGTDNIYLGVEAGNAQPNESNTIRIGKAVIPPTRCFVQGISSAGVVGLQVMVDPAGQLGVLMSSAKTKNNIQDIGQETERINDLRPVKFTYKTDETNTPQFGLIAEEVAEVYPELVVYDKNGDPMTVKYHLLNAILLDRIQKSAKERKEMQQKLDDQSQLILRFQQQLESLERKIQDN